MANCNCNSCKAGISSQPWPAHMHVYKFQVHVYIILCHHNYYLCSWIHKFIKQVYTYNMSALIMIAYTYMTIGTENHFQQI